jgi:small subunit ribosomal protein S18
METENEETKVEEDAPERAPAAEEAPAAEGAAASEGEAPARARDAGAPGEGEAPGRARDGAAGDERRPRRGGRRRRVCIMCADKMKSVDHKNVSFLRRFISDRGRIDTRRKTSACAKHQRAIARAIKRARHLALLPYTPEHIRGSGLSHR